MTDFVNIMVGVVLFVTGLYGVCRLVGVLLK